MDYISGVSLVFTQALSNEKKRSFSFIRTDEICDEAASGDAQPSTGTFVT